MGQKDKSESAHDNKVNRGERSRTQEGKREREKRTVVTALSFRACWMTKDFAYRLLDDRSCSHINKVSLDMQKHSL